MSKKISCIICSEPLEPMTKEELAAAEDRNNYILQNFCTQFGIPDEGACRWNFQSEPLPFCTPCQKTVMNLNLVHQRLEAAQKSIIKIKNNIKGMVLDHVNDGDRVDDDIRVKMIRDFILGQKEPETEVSSSSEDDGHYTHSLHWKSGSNSKSEELERSSEEHHHRSSPYNNVNNNNSIIYHKVSKGSSSVGFAGQNENNVLNQNKLNATFTTQQNSHPREEADNVDDDDEWPTRKEQVKAVKLADSDNWTYSGYKFRGSNESGFKCSCCNHPTIYKQRSDVIRHIRVRHLKNAKRHLCWMCPMKFVRPARLRRHLKNVHHSNINNVPSGWVNGHLSTAETQTHNYNLYSPQSSNVACDLCHQKFSSDKQLQLHIQEAHYDHPPPHFPVKKFEQVTSPFEKKGRKKPQIFECTFCGSQFKFVENLVNHIKYFHPKAKINKSNDDDTSSFESNTTTSKTTTSMNFDDESLYFECPHCKKKYIRYGAFRNHLSQKHMKKQQPLPSRSLQVIERHICQFCGKTYGVEQLLRNHKIECHGGGGPQFLLLEEKKEEDLNAAEEVDMDHGNGNAVAAADDYSDLEDDVVATQQEEEKEEEEDNNEEEMIGEHIKNLNEEGDKDVNEENKNGNDEGLNENDKIVDEDAKDLNDGGAISHKKWSMAPCWVLLTPLRL